MPKWCPNWHGEFVDGVETCPDCGAALELEEPQPEPPGATDTDEFALVRAGLRVDQLTPLVRRAAIAISGIAGFATLSWVYTTWYILDRTGGETASFGFDDDGTTLGEYVYVVAANLGQLLLAGLLFAAATALWLLSRWLDFRLREELYLDGE